MCSLQIEANCYDPLVLNVYAEASQDQYYMRRSRMFDKAYWGLIS